MSFSNEIIKLLDDLGARFGIAIDWTSKNIMPYITELSKRIINYETILDIIGFIIFVLIGIGFIFCFKKLLQSYQIAKKTENDTFLFDYYSNSGIEPSGWGIGMLFLLGLLGAGFLVGVLCQGTEVIKDIVLPETILLEYIKNFSNILK